MVPVGTVVIMRSEGDSWDITTTVGSTALFVAAARVLAARDPDPLAIDPFAEVFVRAAGPDWAGVLDGEQPGHPLTGDEFGRAFRDYQAGRTRYFDNYAADAVAAGVRQVVILAAGLDSRAYRLAWPDGAVVYELDRPQVLEFKRETLAANGDKPRAERREVAADLREDWPMALRRRGFDPALPTAWLIEGLLMYLPSTAQNQLFEALVALSAPGSRVGIEQMDELSLRAAGDFAGTPQNYTGAMEKWVSLIYNEPRDEVAAWLNARGWRAERVYLADYIRANGRTPSDDPQGGLQQRLVSLVTGILE